MEETAPETQKNNNPISLLIFYSIFILSAIFSFSVAILPFSVNIFYSTIFWNFRNFWESGKVSKLDGEDSGVDENENKTENAEKTEQIAEIPEKRVKFDEIVQHFEKIAENGGEAMGIDKKSESNFDEKFQLSTENISNSAKILEFTENLSEKLMEYLKNEEKSIILATFRDIATLTNFPSTLENTARIQYKRRKLKFMKLPENAEILEEILKNSTENPGSAGSWLYILKESMTAQQIAENRKFVNESKKIAENFHEMTEDFVKILEDSSVEFIFIQHGGSLVWFNPAL